MIYKTLKKVSDYCQLLDKRKYKTETDRGVTFTNNGNGSITINGTPTGSYYSLYTITVELNRIIPGHKYAILGIVDHLSCMIIGNYTGGYIFKGSDNIYTLPEHEYTRFVYEIRANLGYTYSNVLVKPQLFDLTEMYGSGNEPATVEEFRSKFPNDLYDYSPRCFVTSYKDCLKVSDYCQLLDKSKFPATTTKAGVTFTNNGDGSIVVNGTCTADTSFYVGRNVALKNGHQYLLFGAPIRGTWTTIIWTVDKLGSNDNLTGNRYTHKGDNTTSNCYIFVAKDFVADNLVFKPQLFDLTEIYGAGNEPTTVEQFRADFPDKLYDYKPYSIVPSYKKSLMCKTKNLFDINSANVRIRDDGSFSSNVIHTSNFYRLNVTPGETYTLSYYAVSAGTSNSLNLSVQTGDYYTDGTLLVLIYNSSTTPNRYISRSFKIPEGATKITFSTVDTTVKFKNFMIELGSTATEYHPYGYL